MGAFEEMPRVRTSTKLTRMAARAKAIQPPREYVKIIATPPNPITKHESHFPEDLTPANNRQAAKGSKRLK